MLNETFSSKNVILDLNPKKTPFIEMVFLPQVNNLTSLNYTIDLLVNSDDVENDSIIITIFSNTSKYDSYATIIDPSSVNKLRFTNFNIFVDNSENCSKLFNDQCLYNNSLTISNCTELCMKNDSNCNSLEMKQICKDNIKKRTRIFLNFEQRIVKKTITTYTETTEFDHTTSDSIVDNSTELNSTIFNNQTKILNLHSTSKTIVKSDKKKFGINVTVFIIVMSCTLFLAFLALFPLVYYYKVTRPMLMAEFQERKSDLFTITSQTTSYDSFITTITKSDEGSVERKNGNSVKSKENDKKI